MTSTGSAGGFVGGSISSDPPSPSANNFWDTERTGQASSATHANMTSTGLTTAQMQSDCAGSNSSDDICSLGSAFVFSAGSYPKLKKCTTCEAGPILSFLVSLLMDSKNLLVGNKKRCCCKGKGAT